MESRRKRKSSQIFKWVCYTLLMLLCTVLQTMPGLFQLGAAKPLYLLPLALAVSVFEGEFAGAVFGAVCGLMWDYTAGRTVGMLALELMHTQFCRLRRGAALPQGHRPELFAHCGGVRGAGAGLRLAVLLLHAGLQRGVEPLFVVRAPQRGAEHPGQPAHLLGGAEDQH